jgi:hypothetical protein
MASRFENPGEKALERFETAILGEGRREHCAEGAALLTKQNPCKVLAQ